MDDDIEFFPNYVLDSSREASQNEIVDFRKKFDKDFAKLIEQTKDFYERMMLSKGVFYTKNEGAIYFHDVYGLTFDQIPCAVFLAYYPEEKGREFEIEADIILHLHLFSDQKLNEYMKQLNKEETLEAGQGLTHFYFNKDTAEFHKLILTPAKTTDKRKSLVKKNDVFQVFESEIMVEDLEIIEKYIKLLLRKMKETKISKRLA